MSRELRKIAECLREAREDREGHHAVIDALMHDVGKVRKELDQMREEFVAHREAEKPKDEPEGEPWCICGIPRSRCPDHKPKQQEHICGECADWNPNAYHGGCSAALEDRRSRRREDGSCFRSKKPSVPCVTVANVTGNDSVACKQCGDNNAVLVNGYCQKCTVPDEPEYCCGNFKYYAEHGGIERHNGRWTGPSYTDPSGPLSWFYLYYCPFQGCGKELDRRNLDK